jgi:hypothetical protein
MHLDYINDVNEFGESIVRLYGFGMAESQKFKALLTAWITNPESILDLSAIPFITCRNCNVIMVIGDEDEGILTNDYETFYCKLTLEGYQNLIALLEPFCMKETLGYQWLYDIDNPIDFLFSPAGTAEDDEPVDDYDLL